MSLWQIAERRTSDLHDQAADCDAGLLMPDNCIMSQCTTEEESKGPAEEPPDACSWVTSAAQTVTDADVCDLKTARDGLQTGILLSSAHGAWLVSLYRSLQRKKKKKKVGRSVDWWIDCPVALWNLFCLFCRSELRALFNQCLPTTQTWQKEFTVCALVTNVMGRR